MVTTLFWDLHAACNAACLYCSAASARDRGGKVLPLGSILTSLDHFRAAGVDSIVLLGGEPTLHPDLLAIARGAIDRGIQVGIATNGLLLPKELRRGLLRLEGLSVNFSIDSFFEDENDAVRGSGYLEQSLGNLRRLLSERETDCAPLQITIQATLTRVNLLRLEQSLLRLLELGVDTLLVERMRRYPWQAESVQRLAPRPAEWIRGAGRVAHAAARLHDPSRIQLNYGHARLRALLRDQLGYPIDPVRRCPGGLQVAVLGLEGTLHPCRNVQLRPVPSRDDGRPWFAIQSIRGRDPGAADFLSSRYFIDFFNFAHSAEIYGSLAMCRICPHYLDCEPCPLDVAAFGPRVLGECRWLVAHGLPTGTGR